MNFGMAIEWQRCNSEVIKRLRALGEPVATKLVAAYCAMYGDRNNPHKTAEWMRLCDEMIKMGCIDTERKILQERFGYKLTAREMS